MIQALAMVACTEIFICAKEIEIRILTSDTGLKL